MYDLGDDLGMTWKAEEGASYQSGGYTKPLLSLHDHIFRELGKQDHFYTMMHFLKIWCCFSMQKTYHFFSICFQPTQNHFFTIFGKTLKMGL